ncbi:MAG: response regulator [Desulfobacterales bacterium]|nr:response regulator [Desulfobacterales bacterium]
MNLNIKNVSIRLKLKIIILSVCGLVLVLTTFIFISSYIIEFRKNKAHELSGLAQVLGTGCVPALDFFDSDAAYARLGALKVKPDVSGARIFDHQGKIFATYTKEKIILSILPGVPGKDGYAFSGKYLTIFQSINSDEEFRGKVFIIYDLREMHTAIFRYCIFVVFIAVLAFLVAFLLSDRLQKLISGPLLELLETTREISFEKDYSIRAVPPGNDEIGLLISGFNKMLDEIQARDNELAVYRGDLEEQVRARTRLLEKKQDELQTALKQAAAASKSKSEFLANMSHEIRTPLNAVLGFTDLLCRSDPDPKQLSFLEAIRTSSKNLLTLINDILDLSRIEAGKMELHYEMVNPHRFFQEIRNIFSFHIADKKLEFPFQIAPMIPKQLLIDEVRLRQVLFNLLGNAVKFTEHGFIRLSVLLKDMDTVSNMTGLTIQVQDSGIGMPEQALARIFDFFEQHDEHISKQYGGTGLGLAISKRLVEMMGGTITVNSTVGKGSTFVLDFPDIRADVSESKNSSENLVPCIFNFNKAVILTVDDQETNNRLISEYFDGTGVNVVTALNGKEALALLPDCNPDVVLMDLRMPVMDGFETLKAMKNNSLFAEIPVLALTASGMKQDEKKIKEAGFDDLLIKPVPMERLFDTLSKYLDCTVTEPEELNKEPDKETDKTSSEIDSQTDQAPDEHLSDLLSLLETQGTDLWKSAVQNDLFEEIEAFALQIKTWGQNYSHKRVLDYSETLLFHVSSFDIEKIQENLAQFPELLQNLKRQ